jgi:protein gp37
MRDYLRGRYGFGHGPLHIWCGVSVEDGRATSRVVHLRGAPAGTRFLSIEPLLGPIGSIEFDGIDWVIAGGESGPGARPIKIEWVRELRDRCRTQGVAFFFKQWGGLRPKSGGRLLDGQEWNGFPHRHLSSANLAS